MSPTIYCTVIRLSDQGKALSLKNLVFSASKVEEYIKALQDESGDALDVWNAGSGYDWKDAIEALVDNGRFVGYALKELLERSSFYSFDRKYAYGYSTLNHAESLRACCEGILYS